MGISSVTESDKDGAGLKVTGNGYESSRLGVKAAHPLGGGLTALAQYEFGADPSAYNNTLNLNRVATLGVTGGFGTVTAGLQWTPYDSAWGFDQLEYNKFSAAGSSWYNGAHGDNGNTGNGNAKNSIAYTTPNMGGFDATVLYANTKEAKATGTPNDTVPYLGVGANYTAGPLSINFGYEQVASAQHLGTGANPGDKTNAYIIGAAYDLGAAKIGAGFEQANVDALGASWKDAGYTISLSVPVSAETTFALGYASETTTTAGKSDGKSTGFGAQAIYNLTKQAAVYGGAFQTKTTAAGATTESTFTKYAAGLRYNF